MAGIVVTEYAITVSMRVVLDFGPGTVMSFRWDRLRSD
jgi:hypothetical protein